MKYCFRLFFVVIAIMSGAVAQGFCSDVAPLRCGRFDIQLHAGVNPIRWRDRGGLYGPTFEAPSNIAIIKAFDLPDFDCLYKTPWIVGGQVGYAYSDNMRFYLEGFFSKAAPQCPSRALLLRTETGAPNGTTITLGLDSFELGGFNAGVEYYMNRFWQEKVSFFIGAKVGFVHHRQVMFSAFEVIPTTPPLTIVLIPDTDKQRIFKTDAAVSGGFNFGFDILLNDCWSFVMSAGLVGTAGPKSSSDVMLIPSFAIPPRNFMVTHTDSEILFPVTFALRYTF